jgi:hypothetical protein
MTKRRDPLTFHRALTVIAGRIGWDKCAMIVGRSERLVRMWSDPDADSEISIIDALRLDKAFLAAGGDHAPSTASTAFRSIWRPPRAICA